MDSKIKKYFSPKQDLFDQIMMMRGEVFRELDNRRTQRITLGNKQYFLKQHFGVGWREIFKNLLQLRLPVISAKNEWCAIQRLDQLGVATMHLAGYGSRGKNPARKQSFLLTDELTQVISLEDFCKNWREEPPAFLRKRKLIKEVARIARTLHENGMNHRDFYICHFLLDTVSLDKIYLIDLHRAEIRRRTPERWIVKDLAGLYFSSKDIGLTARDLWYFMREYAQQPLRKVLNKNSLLWKKVRHRGDKLYHDEH